MMYTRFGKYKTIPAKKLAEISNDVCPSHLKFAQAWLATKLSQGFFCSYWFVQLLRIFLRSMRCYSTKPPTVFRIEKEESWTSSSSSFDG